MSTPDPLDVAAQHKLAQMDLANALAEVSRLSDVYARAKSKVDAWKTPMRGELWEACVNRWRAAHLALDRATAVRRRAQVDAYLLARQLRRMEVSA